LDGGGGAKESAESNTKEGRMKYAYKKDWCQTVLAKVTRRKRNAPHKRASIMLKVRGTSSRSGGYTGKTGFLWQLRENPGRKRKGS